MHVAGRADGAGPPHLKKKKNLKAFGRAAASFKRRVTFSLRPHPRRPALLVSYDFFSLSLCLAPIKME